MPPEAVVLRDVGLNAHGALGAIHQFKRASCQPLDRGTHPIFAKRLDLGQVGSNRVSVNDAVPGPQGSASARFREEMVFALDKLKGFPRLLAVHEITDQLIVLQCRTPSLLYGLAFKAGEMDEQNKCLTNSERFQEIRDLQRGAGRLRCSPPKLIIIHRPLRFRL
jgi:hypothetical protein